MSELVFPEENMYTIEHVWLRMESATTALVGISDFAQTQLGEVAYVDLPDVGSAFDGGDEFGSVESPLWNAEADPAEKFLRIPL